jgi:DNA-binding MarR family transcriptional regulator
MPSRRKPLPAQPAAEAAPAQAAPGRDAQAVRVLRQFRQVFNAVKTHFQQVEKSVGMGGAQVWALGLVRDRPGLGVGALAEAMAVHQSTASNLVRGLVDRQLVAATKDGADRRAVRLHLTPAGARLLQGAPGPFAGVLPDALKALDAATLARLERDLARLIEVLGADEGGAAIPLSGL